MSKLVNFVLLTALLQNCVESCEEQLKSVIVLYRHGDRAPIKSYRNDPYNESYWPSGFGQLTNIGKSQHYELGQWLRVRYASFLPSKYKKSDIKVLSSNTDRCLMSAASNLAGLYPPVDEQIWNPQLHWQPIPIHTTPEKQDAVLAQSEPCPKYEKLYQTLMETSEFENILQYNKYLFEYLSHFSGENITNLLGLLNLYNVLFIQDLYNFTLPAWARKFFSGEQQLKKLSDLAWVTFTYTPELAKLKAGPLIDLIVSHFESVTYNSSTVPKFLMLSAHDATIVSLLHSLQIYDLESPPYAATVIFELRKDKGNHFVNIFYKKSVTASNLTLPDCDFNCDLNDFINIVQPLRINLTDRKKECEEG